MATMTQTASLEQLEARCKTIRRHIIEMISAAKSGHPGGSLSAVEILVSLYMGGHLHHDPSNPTWAHRDRFLLSKGHACPVLYSVLAECGYVPVDQLNTFRRLGSIYQGHPDRRFMPILDGSTGSLGQGLSLAIGMGLAARLDQSPSRAYVVLGDGEIQEGQIWEAAMFGGFHKVDNVVAIVDYNKIQLDGFVKDILDLKPLADKWRSFGWHVIDVDGHSLTALASAWDEAKATKGKPSVVIAQTIKGKGVSFMENNPKWHGTAPNADESALALKELA
ncbi:MAG: transketolase [Acidobacteriia bacterium]|nr:transketolase [Terriglobia bacterium]